MTKTRDDPVRLGFVSDFEHSRFGIVSDFEFRASNLEPSHLHGRSQLPLPRPGRAGLLALHSIDPRSSHVNRMGFDFDRPEPISYSAFEGGEEVSAQNLNPENPAAGSPGLIDEWREIFALAESIRVQAPVLDFKKRLPALWVVVLGGTGTGKSTIFNALAGKQLSETGVERPKTTGPILYAHERCELARGIPIAGMEATAIPLSHDVLNPTAGLSGGLIILEHGREEFSHIVLADTPDLDSVELVNRRAAEDLYHLADAVIFVTSQEKYADEVPYLFLLRVLRDQRLCYFILNKADASSKKEDVISTLQEVETSLPNDQVWLFPYMPDRPFHTLAHHPAFLDFRARIMKELSREEMPGLRKRIIEGQRKAFEEKLDRLTLLSDKEQAASREWLAKLRRMEKESAEEFLREQRQSFTSKSQEVLKGEIRRLFSKYDVLAKPRRLVTETILAPLRFIGVLEKSDARKHKEELRKVRQKMDLVPIQTAIDKFNHLVLERLSPPDEESPLFRKLREPETLLTPDEIRDLVWKAQDQLGDWLEKRFDSLSRSLPRTKRWGIHTTSILWGIVILSFEVAVGGGFTIIDAVLSSALAPLVTKGTVELFAYHEIQKITRGLAERYQEALVSVIHAQEARYERCLQSLMMTDEAKGALLELGRQVAVMGKIRNSNIEIRNK